MLKYNILSNLFNIRIQKHYFKFFVHCLKRLKYMFKTVFNLCEYYGIF